MFPLTLSFPLPTLSRRTLIIAGFATLPLIALGAIAFQSHGSHSEAVKKSTNTVYLATPGIPNTGTPVQNPVVEVHVAGNGLTLVRGARVISVNGSNLTASTDLENAHMVWSIHERPDAKMFDTSGALLEASAIHVGDIITVTGMLSGSLAVPHIEAEYVRLQ